MYEQVLGADFARLPTAVQRFHRLAGHAVLQGWVETGAPDTWLARCLAFCLGAPRARSEGRLRFELNAEPQHETWTRHFPTRSMTSRLSPVAGQLVERLGAARLVFALTATERTLSMTLVRMHFGGIACPRWLMPRVVAEETGRDDRFHFLVTAAVPVAGVVASYRGHLDLGPEAGP